VFRCLFQNVLTPVSPPAQVVKLQDTLFRQRHWSIEQRVGFGLSELLRAASPACRALSCTACNRHADPAPVLARIVRAGTIIVDGAGNGRPAIWNARVRKDPPARAGTGLSGGSASSTSVVPYAPAVAQGARSLLMTNPLFRAWISRCNDRASQEN